MKSDNHSPHPTFSQSADSETETSTFAGMDETEETYVPSADMEDSALAPTGLSNPFWT